MFVGSAKRKTREIEASGEQVGKPQYRFRLVKYICRSLIGA